MRHLFELLVNLMPYLSHRKLRLDDPLSVIPDWLILDYQNLCEPDLWERVLFPLCSRRHQAARDWLCEEAVLARAVVWSMVFNWTPSPLINCRNSPDSAW